jgi:hypothetical protein
MTTPKIKSWPVTEVKNKYTGQAGSPARAVFGNPGLNAEGRRTPRNAEGCSGFFSVFLCALRGSAFKKVCRKFENKICR